MHFFPLLSVPTSVPLFSTAPLALFISQTVSTILSKLLKWSRLKIVQLSESVANGLILEECVWGQRTVSFSVRFIIRENIRMNFHQRVSWSKCYIPAQVNVSLFSNFLLPIHSCLGLLLTLRWCLLDCSTSSFNLLLWQ